LLWEGEETPDASLFNTIRELPGGFLARVGAVASAVDELNPDVIHAHSSWAGVYTRVRRLPGRVIYQPHCYKFEDPVSARPLRLAYRLVEQALARRADVIVALSPHEESAARGLHSMSEVRVLPNVPSIPLATDASIDKIDDRVIMVGRISPQKDPAFFLDVARQVRLARPSVKFVWIGDGDPALRRKLTAMDVDVTGWLSARELTVELTRPGVYFHSAAYEGFPLSVLDAAASGRPIVARAIHAFHGFPVVTAPYSSECATLLIEAMEGREDVVGRLRQARRDLLRLMTPERQARVLNDLYRA